MLNKQPVGIDALSLYAGPQRVSFTDIAFHRGFNTKELEHAGFIWRSVIPPFEDTVTLAVNAAKSIVDGADCSSVELLIVATETGLDYEKSLGTYVHKMLGLNPRCRNFEIKQACYAGTAGLQMGLSRIASHPDKKALSVMADLARPRFGDVAELSGGCGAVAVLLSANPRLFIVDPCSGYATCNVSDVMRPTNTLEIGNGLLSLYTYLDLLENAWLSYQTELDACPFDQLRYVVYHTPIISLAAAAHAALCDMNLQADNAAHFERGVTPSLNFIKQIGNIYSGNLYACLASLIISEGKSAAGARIGLFSYGSGACAEFFSGVIVPQANTLLEQQHIAGRLESRQQINVEAYEHSERLLIASLSEPDVDTPVNLMPDLYEKFYAGRKLLILDGVHNYSRSYRWS